MSSAESRIYSDQRFFSRRGILYLILVVLAALTAASYWLHWAFIIDDAAISFSYARSFANGYGLGALYPGAPRVEGYSNLLWVILLGLTTRLGVDTLLASKILGLVFSLGAVVVLFFSLRLFIRHQWLLCGLVLVPISLTFSFWSASGLENGLYGFLILLAVHFLIREEREPAHLPLGSAISLVLVLMTRPEGIIYGLTAFLYKIIQLIVEYWENRKLRNESKVSTKSRWKNLLVWTAIFSLGTLAFIGWRLWYFAYPWPNPIYAKAGWYGTDLQKIWLDPQGWIYLRGYFRTFAAMATLPAIFFGGLVSLRGPQRVFVLFALTALALPLYTSDWMVNYRFVYPFIPFGTALILLGIDQLWEWIAGWFANPQWIAGWRAKPVWLGLLALGLAIWFAYGLARYSWANLRLTQKQLACGYEKPWAEARCLDGKNYWSMAEVETRYAELDDYAQRVGVEDPLYLIPDIGATSYLQNLRIIDLGGLADVHLARARDHQAREQYLFQEQLPEFIQIHSIWTRRTDLTALKAFKDNYLPIEEKVDDDGRVNGTFIRKDLLLSSPPGSISDIAGVESPGSGTADEVQYPQEIAPGLFLAGIQILPTTEADQPLALNLYWYIQSRQETDWQQSIRMTDSAGRVVYQDLQPLGYGWYPTSQWIPGEVLRQHVQFPPGLNENNYSLNVTASNAAGEISSLDGVTLHPTSGQENVDDYSSNSATLVDLFRQAKESWQKGDLDALVSIIQQASSIRKRIHVSQEWMEFANELHTAATMADRQDKIDQAYKLYLAASLANPNDSWAQRGLEETRFQYVRSLIAGNDSK